MTIKLIALDMDGTLLNRQKLVPEKNALAIKKAMDKGIYVTIATGRMPASASYFAKQLNMNCPVVSCNGGVVKDLNTGNFEKYTENVTQLVVCNLNGKIQEIQDELADIFKNRIGLQQNTGYTMDITPPGIDKAVGLSKLAQYLQIDKSEIMASGDGDNDLAMIEYVGLGVAMENAIDDVKNIAQFITKDCDEDGIAYVIDKFI